MSFVINKEFGYRNQILKIGYWKSQILLWNMVQGSGHIPPPKLLESTPGTCGTVTQFISFNWPVVIFSSSLLHSGLQSSVRLRCAGPFCSFQTSKNNTVSTACADIMNNSTVQPPGVYSPEPSCPAMISTLFTILLSAISVATFIGNLLVMACFISTQSLRTSTNYYIINMAVSDLLCACFNWLLYAAEGMLTTRVFITGPVATVVCKLGMYFRGISQVVSVLSLVLIAVDRYVAIVFPLKITIIARGRIRLTLLVLTWIIPVVCGFPYFLYTKIVKVDDQTFCRIVWDKLVGAIFNFTGFLVFYCAPLFAMTILYIRIVKTVRNRPNTADKAQDQLANKRQQQNQKITKILISIVVAFFICWTPLCIYLALKMFHPDFFVRDKCMVMLALFFYLFPSLSTAINPFILFLFSTNYRQALKSLSLKLCYFFRCRFSSSSARRVGSSHLEEEDNDVAMSRLHRGETQRTIIFGNAS